MRDTCTLHHIRLCHSRLEPGVLAGLEEISCRDWGDPGLRSWECDCCRWTPPESWQENGHLRPSTTKDWTLAAALKAWKRTWVPERTATRRHLCATWWDPGQGTQLSSARTPDPRWLEDTKACCCKPLFTVICYATANTDTGKMSFEGLMKKKESLIRKAQ